MTIPSLKNRTDSARPVRLRIQRQRWTAGEQAFRAWDALPGGAAWLSLFAVGVAAIFVPMTAVWAAALLSAYAAARFVLAAVANLWGLWRVQQWEAVDWRTEYHRRATAQSLPLEDVHHVVIIPNYREDLETLRHTLERLAEHPCARNAMTVVLAMEGAEADGARAKAERLQAEFQQAFERFFVVVHPQGIVGEMQCKSANQAWAAQWVKRVLVDDLGCSLDHLVVTAMDSDTVWHPAYFDALRTLFAVDPARYRTYWQAPIRYHGNVWQINPLMRILHAYASAWELAYLAAPWWQALPMSSYSMSLRLLDQAGYWDPDVIADEWHMYIKTFFQRRGDVRLQPVFLPFLANATVGRGIIGAIKARYRQTFRHAWGAKEIGYTAEQIGVYRDMPLRSGLALLLRVAHDNLLAGAGWLVMVAGSQLPVLFHPALLRDVHAAVPLGLVQASFMAITLLTVLLWGIDLRIRPARISPWTWRERLIELASLPLLAVMTLLCVALPVLHAQTHLMLGRTLEFHVAPKR